MTTANAAQQYYHGTGKRKTAIAEVRLYPGGGVQSINGKPLAEIFTWVDWSTAALAPLKATEMLEKFSIVAQVHGGGISAWSHAVRHGVARALLAYDPALRSKLREGGFLTRDSRIKERKKYGLKRARRAPQWTKR
ncbi:MAG: 30S ribosomal protein S9 [Dehalococcoidia bacterium]|nr:30S ribosomal protein S9 [Dehalococcoidia bacterium]